jgi:tripartite-type tricarboxylate transporter receptor subunit TctC
MTRLNRRSLGALFLAVPLAATALLTSGAHAQGYPDRPIELVVPYPPGGTNDVIARMVAEGLGTEFGQRVIILNKPGASAAIGSTYVARSKPDGHTLLLGSQGTHSANPYLLKVMNYDALKDFTPVAMIGKVNNVLVVPSSMPITTLDQYIAYAKKNPGVVNFSHAGTGTSMSLAGELFRLKTGVDIVSVPYQGSAAATLAVVSGEVQSMFANVPSVIQHINNGKLRALGVTGAAPDALLPNVRPIAAQGVPGYEIQSWFGIMAPAGTPQPVVEKLNTAIRKVFAMPENQKKFEELGFTTSRFTAAEFAAFIRADNEAIGGLVKQAGLKPE